MSAYLKIISRLRGIKQRVLRPKVLRRLEVAGSSPPRMRQAISFDDRAKVHRLVCKSDPDQVAQNLYNLIKAEYHSLITGKRVMIKINLNTANPYPASTCPKMLLLLVEILQHLKPLEISVADCSSLQVLPTRRQMKKAGLARLLAGKARIVCFDNGPWLQVPLKGRFLTSVTVPKAALTAECLIALANLKTHQETRYSGALKLAVGYMHPLERSALHRAHLQEKIAELNLVLPPDLVIMDARTAFITGGPNTGQTTAGQTLLIGLDPLAVDVAAYHLLYALKREQGCLEGYEPNPFTVGHLRHAHDLACRTGITSVSPRNL